MLAYAPNFSEPLMKTWLDKSQLSSQGLTRFLYSHIGIFMSQTSLDKSKIKFLLLEGVHQSAVDTLTAAGYSNIDYVKSALPEEELKERI
ncbi:MAG: hypothetical protein ACI810_002668, partial [Gammaproteobacteria bacterium]